MSQHQDKKPWSTYYENQKKLWYSSGISLYIKAVVRLVELHRSDSKGWSLSIRKIARLLNISTNTALSAVNNALNLGFLESNTQLQRKRRKLRLSVLLRAPIEHETSDTTKLVDWGKQPVSPLITPSVSTVEPVNNKEISNANINESPIKKETMNESFSYRESESYKRAKAMRDKLARRISI